jgi:two-component system, chemotaxis family, chemotaxis protein CheY
MRVLIVDDSRFIRDFLRLVLEPMGATCEEAENGREALQAVEGDAVFDLILLDLNMPVMDGLECVKLLRDTNLSPRTKVMMVTTEADNSLIAEALDLGADEFLMKPFTAASLREKMGMLGFALAA